MIISSVRNGPLLSRGAVVKATDQRHLLQNPTYVSREDLFAWAPPGAPPRYYIRTFSRTNWVDSIREMPNPVGACYMTSRAATISGDPNAEFPPKCYSARCAGCGRSRIDGTAPPAAPTWIFVKDGWGLTMTPLEEVERAHNV